MFISRKDLFQITLKMKRKNLDKHYHDRALLMLNNIKRLEDNNLNDKIKDITNESLKTVLNKLSDPQSMKMIQKQSFEAALEGLRLGKMTYSNDPILPMLIEEIKRRTNTLKNITPEEENKMFALTSEQKSQIIDQDSRSKVDFLSQLPNVSSAGVKNTDIYKSIVTRMKRRIETNFKK